MSARDGDWFAAVLDAVRRSGRAGARPWEVREAVGTGSLRVSVALRALAVEEFVVRGADGSWRGLPPLPFEADRLARAREAAVVEVTMRRRRGARAGAR